MSHPMDRAARRERNERALAAREHDRQSTRDYRAALTAERVTVNGRSYSVADLARTVREDGGRE